MQFLNSSIKEVTVFMDRARITRVTDFKSGFGEKRYVIGNLPPLTDEKSIQVKIEGDGLLKEISVKREIFGEEEEKAKKSICSERENLKESLTEISDKLDSVKNEKILLQRITEKISTSVEGERTELNPEKWINILDFYRSKKSSLDEELRELIKEEKKIREDIEDLSSKIDDLKHAGERSEKRIEILLAAQKESEIRLYVSYIVKGPSWTPFFDLRVNSETKKMEIFYHGNIRQNTGENWEDVLLSLSTSRPRKGGDEPELFPWHVDVLRKGRISDLIPGSGETKDKELRRENNQFIVKSNLSSYRYDLPGKHTVKSDNKNHNKTITIESFDAKFDFFSVPKLSSHAYLKSHVKNHSSFHFLPGNANVFIDNSFVATTAMGSVSPGEEFSTALGMDEGFIIRYSFLRKYQKNDSFFHKRNRFIYEYEIEITNNRSSREKIEIKDQLPVSGSEFINVTLLEPKYEKDSETLSRDRFNIIKWTCDIESGEKIVIPFSFSVEYSKELEIAGMD